VTTSQAVPAINGEHLSPNCVRNPRVTLDLEQNKRLFMMGHHINSHAEKYV